MPFVRISIPLNAFPEITFRSAAVVPPMRLPVPAYIPTPWLFPTAMLPVGSSPMYEPVTTLFEPLPMPIPSAPAEPTNPSTTRSLIRLPEERSSSPAAPGARLPLSSTSGPDGLVTPAKTASVEPSMLVPS